MRRPISLILVLLVLPLVPISAAEVQTIDVAAIFDSGNGLELRRYEIPVSRSGKFVDELSASAPVIAAGIVNRRHTLNDPRFGEQWGLSRLDVPKVRELGTGKDVIVAVIDTGVDGSHPELAGRVLPGIDLVDEGGDGRTDPNGHGTHVAGVIAASVDGSGIEGLAPEAKILPIRVLGRDGSGDDADVAFGILWAVRNGAKVINLSLGGTDIDPLLEDAVKQATSAGVVVIAAAGNSGPSGDVFYPAAHPTVVAVGATGPDDRVALYSTRGSYVDVAAPGTMILSTWPGGYRYESGTSMATPFVSAAVAILIGRSEQPSAAVKRILDSAYDIGGSGADNETGAGLLDVVAAATTGAPRTDQPGSVTAPSFPLVPMPSLPALPLPSLPPLPNSGKLPSFPEFPASGKLPQLPQLPELTPPNQSLPSLPRPSDPIRRSLAPLESFLTAQTSRLDGKIKVTLALRSTNFPLAYRTVTVRIETGKIKKTVAVRTDSRGLAMVTFTGSVRSLEARWAGDLVTKTTSTKVTVTEVAKR